MRSRRRQDGVYFSPSMIEVRFKLSGCRTGLRQTGTLSILKSEGAVVISRKFNCPTLRPPDLRDRAEASFCRSGLPDPSIEQRGLVIGLVPLERCCEHGRMHFDDFNPAVPEHGFGICAEMIVDYECADGVPLAYLHHGRY
jgi:hypothetical protein